MNIAYYSVYRTEDDMPLAIHSTAEECARVLGITLASFLSQASRQRKGKKNAGQKHYQILRDEDDEP